MGEVSAVNIRNCFAKCGITGETSGGNDELDKDFVELFSELTKEMVDIDDQLTPEGYENFDSVEYTSLPEIETDDVDWRISSIAACINEYERETEVPSKDNENDTMESSQESEPMLS